MPCLTNSQNLGVVKLPFIYDCKDNRLTFSFWGNCQSGLNCVVGDECYWDKYLL